jgi:hypothetical protein
MIATVTTMTPTAEPEQPSARSSAAALASGRATPALARKVGEQRMQLAQRAGGEGAAAALVELVGGQPARDGVSLKLPATRSRSASDARIDPLRMARMLRAGRGAAAGARRGRRLARGAAVSG